MLSLNRIRGRDKGEMYLRLVCLLHKLLQRPIWLPLEKLEQDVLHFCATPSCSFRFKRSWWYWFLLLLIDKKKLQARSRPMKPSSEIFKQNMKYKICDFRKQQPVLKLVAQAIGIGQLGSCLTFAFVAEEGIRPTMPGMGLMRLPWSSASTYKK